MLESELKVSGSSRDSVRKKSIQIAAVEDEESEKLIQQKKAKKSVLLKVWHFVRESMLGVISRQGK